VVRLARFVNKAYAWVWLKLFPQNQDAEAETTVNTVAGQNWVTAPYGNITQVKTDANRILNLLPWHEFELNYRRNTLQELQTGFPGACAVYMRRLYFYPAPDNVYPVTVRGNASLTALALDADVPDLPEEWHDLIVSRAVYEEALYNRDFQLAQLKGADCVDLLATIRQQANSQFGTGRILSEEEIVDPNWWLTGMWIA
jgi:hypothetical protein